MVKDVKVLGPAEAPIPRLKTEFRYQLVLKAPPASDSTDSSTTSAPSPKNATAPSPASSSTSTL
ncbi:MAG: hypothetical protein HY820_15770 [Acidobacteria bacterium]|nr:hypothetical protein [Acidobacteriota bacterium]